MDRIGLSFDTLKAIKPDIIQVSVSVAGRRGPLGPMRGYGNSAAALSGLAHLSGWPDRDPHMPPFAYGDVVAPMFATVAMLAALEHRRLTGEGQHIDISQVEPLVHVIADQLHGEAKPGNRSPRYAPHGAFPARGVDQWIAIAVRDDAEWAKLAEIARIADARFATLAGRKAHEDELEAALSAFTRRHDKRTLADKLAALGIPAEPVNDGRDVWRDPELTERGHFREITHDKLGTCDMPAPPLRFSDSGIDVGPPPNLGQHNHTVFVDLLGMSEVEVAELTEAGALA
jgi:benzylsuccinate CoA-transferase BbsF subunit